MLKNILLVILILAVSSILAQNSNTMTNQVPERRVYPVNSMANSGAYRSIPSNTTIRGRVYYEDDGKPIKRTVISLFTYPTGRIEDSTITDENGNFEIKHVWAGKYFPRVSSPTTALRTYLVGFYNIFDVENKDQFFEEITRGVQEIAVDGINDLTVEIPIKRGGVISGRVTYPDGNPVTGAGIHLFYKKDGKLRPLSWGVADDVLFMRENSGVFQTDDRGVYRLTGLPDGEYVVGVAENTTHGNQDLRNNPISLYGAMFSYGSFLKTYYPKTAELDEATILKVEPGKELSGINITVPHWKLHQVSGKVVSKKDGKPVKAIVYLISKGEVSTASPYSTTALFPNFYEADEDGSWHFKVIPTGQYSLWVVPFGSNGEYDYERLTPDRDGYGRLRTKQLVRYSKVTQDLTVKDSDVENMEVRTGLSATISGSVSFNKKDNFSDNMTIKVFNEKDELISARLVYLDNQIISKSPIVSKSFKIEGFSTGRFQLQITSIYGTFFVKTATINGIDLLKNSFELTEGQTLGNIKIVLEKVEKK